MTGMSERIPVAAEPKTSKDWGVKRKKPDSRRSAKGGQGPGSRDGNRKPGRTGGRSSKQGGSQRGETRTRGQATQGEGGRKGTRRGPARPAQGAKGPSRGAKAQRGQPRSEHRRGSADGPHVVVGRRFCVEALRGGTVDHLFVAADLEGRLEELEELARAQGIPLRYEGMDALDRRCHGARHQGVVATGPTFPYVTLDHFANVEAPLLVALDEVSDPQNLGAILRSALAFGADGALLPKHRSAALTPTVVRASAGATERSTIARVTNLQRALQTLADDGREIVGLAADGEVAIDAMGPAPRGRVIVIGSEGAGLRRLVRERCTYHARIPQLASFDSLNASVAAAIALYEAARARTA